MQKGGRGMSRVEEGRHSKRIVRGGGGAVGRWGGGAAEGAGGDGGT